jgi:hypothetical protein
MTRQVSIFDGGDNESLPSIFSQKPAITHGPRTLFRPHGTNMQIKAGMIRRNSYDGRNLYAAIDNNNECDEC